MPRGTGEESQFPTLAIQLSTNVIYVDDFFLRGKESQSPPQTIQSSTSTSQLATGSTPAVGRIPLLWPFSLLRAYMEIHKNGRFLTLQSPSQSIRSSTVHEPEQVHGRGRVRRNPLLRPFGLLPATSRSPGT